MIQLKDLLEALQTLSANIRISKQTVILIFANNLFSGSFFENFAYLLPCLVNAAINFLSFLLVYFVLPETLASKRYVQLPHITRGALVAVIYGCLGEKSFSSFTPALS
jgi:hypothetical protein